MFESAGNYKVCGCDSAVAGSPCTAPVPAPGSPLSQDLDSSLRLGLILFKMPSRRAELEMAGSALGSSFCAPAAG